MSKHPKTNPDDSVIADSAIGVGSGMTKREHFAAMAMQGLCALNPDFIDKSIVDGGIVKSLLIAELAVLQADALIAALNKGAE